MITLQLLILEATAHILTIFHLKLIKKCRYAAEIVSFTWANK
ncbi:hypothetical protein [uncultured Arcanobacterium sp.]|nr:hypothetical protein [uncultured Arcanobacterium sp.]